MNPENQADITAVINVAKHGHHHDEIVRQVAHMRRYTWGQADQLVRQVMVEQYIHIMIKRLEMVLWYPVAAVTTIGTMWLVVSSPAAMLIIGFGVLSGMLMHVDVVDVLLAHIKQNREHAPQPMSRASQHLYDLLVYVTGAVLVVLALMLGIAEGVAI